MRRNKNIRNIHVFRGGSQARSRVHISYMVNVVYIAHYYIENDKAFSLLTCLFRRRRLSRRRRRLHNNYFQLTL